MPLVPPAGASRRGPTLRECFLMHAIARLALHPHITNIQASWVKMGPQRAAQLLAAGCNDMGGVLMNESITKAAGAVSWAHGGADPRGGAGAAAAHHAVWHGARGAGAQGACLFRPCAVSPLLACTRGVLCGHMKTCSAVLHCTALPCHKAEIYLPRPHARFSRSAASSAAGGSGCCSRPASVTSASAACGCSSCS